MSITQTRESSTVVAPESRTSEIQQQDFEARTRASYNQGVAAANQALSEKRAQAVVAWLTSHGVGAARLTAKGFGASKPVGDNISEEGRAKNRRVELAKQ